MTQSPSEKETTIDEIKQLFDAIPDAYVKNMDDNFIVKLSDESLRDLVDCFEDRFLNPDTL